MDELWGVWFLIGAALVFFMQCGFAMVETGFTRAKNAGNIIMKNLMDFCIGTVVFIAIGFALMLSENYVMGLIGKPNWQIFTDYANFDWSNFVFNLVFCATAATIVSGAMAERTKFISYCVYSAAISAVVYPIEAGWVWNSQGWLNQLGFVDFAGSAAIHTVGGTAALIGAAMLGPRIGKYVKNKKTGKLEAKAIPGHSVTMGALGCFILWFGWYGFNGAAATYLNGIGGLASIFVTTTIAPAVASVVTMIFTWFRYGKPDVSMTLNASLAGLVGITAGCATMDALGSIFVGLVSGFLVVLVVEVMDKVLHIDDPVGAVAVHFANGIWGTLACGLFNVDGGLFYGGGFHQLGVQLLGIVAIIAWTTVTMLIIFTIIKKTIGLRVSPEEEIGGLDFTEHGLESAYADFAPSVSTTTYSASEAPVTTVAKDTVPVKTVPVKSATVDENGNLISKVVVVMKQERFEAFKMAMSEIGVTGMTVTHVLGCGIQQGKTAYYRGVAREMNLLPKLKVELVVSAVPVEAVVEAAKASLYTGNIGDGKIFVYNVENVVKVRTGEEGYDALQGEDQW
jgi:Amt family ammonium transporter